MVHGRDVQNSNKNQKPDFEYSYTIRFTLFSFAITFIYLFDCYGKFLKLTNGKNCILFALFPKAANLCLKVKKEITLRLVKKNG